MLGLLIPYIVGVLLGVPLAFYYSRYRDRSVAYRLGVGLLVSVGIAITINASLELLDLVGLTADSPNIEANEGSEPTGTEETEPVTPAVEREQQQTWEQEQHYADGTLKAMRTVTRDATGEIVPHGSAATYFPNGQLKWTGNYELGKQVGRWREHYSDGTKEGEGNIFDDGQPPTTMSHSTQRESTAVFATLDRSTLVFSSSMLRRESRRKLKNSKAATLLMTGVTGATDTTCHSGNVSRFKWLDTKQKPPAKRCF